MEQLVYTMYTMVHAWVFSQVNYFDFTLKIHYNSSNKQNIDFSEYLITFFPLILSKDTTEKYQKSHSIPRERRLLLQG